MRLRDLTGQPFGRLTAKKVNRHRRNGHVVWYCKCKCGNYTDVVGSKLTNGHTKSCGCLDSEVSATRVKQMMASRGGFRGSNNPRWRRDWTDEERYLRKEIRMIADPRKKKWRKKVYDRDRYTCQKCKQSKSGTLTAHHIFSWTSHPKLRYVVKNGITLCLKCHIDFHRAYGYGNNTKKQLAEYLPFL